MAEEAQDKNSAEAGKPAEAEVPSLPPIILKKKIDGDHAGGHGGAWKIALADMMTAMMAFFLLMWLLGATTEAQRKSVADYFKPTSHSNVKLSELAGTGGTMGGQSILDPDGMPNTGQSTSMLKRVSPRSEAGKSTDSGTTKNDQNDKSASDLSELERQRIAAEADQQNFDKLEKEVKDKLAQNKQLEKIKDQVHFIREKEGLRIEIIDKADFSMFGLGTNRMQPRAEALIREVAKSVANMPNKIAVRGHTDSLAFAEAGRNNWSLSGERAESTRRMMEAVGLPDTRFARIEGVADTVPFNASDPADPRNRRISITMLYQGGAEPDKAR
ncbi:MAG: flagellar motor protein MotB [Burkholderiaceae bacterium]|jgi:chemotaxis protein MotB